MKVGLLNTAWDEFPPKQPTVRIATPNSTLMQYLQPAFSMLISVNIDVVMEIVV